MALVRKNWSIMILLFVTPVAAFAQLSPGDLSQSHSQLGGLQNCRKCHGGDQELVPGNCLNCHGSIKSQRDTKTGLHSRPEFQQCQTCHVEHQGREFLLIHWKNGQAKFDHAQTQFPLVGAHTKVECRVCHQPRFISSLPAFLNEKIDSSRTFLGLQKNCTNCHRDEHRGQLNQNCLKCHSSDAWMPAAGFDHTKTSFTLTGKHQSVDCAKCHLPESSQPIGDDLLFTRFTNIESQQCSSCHSDPHKNSLGENCSSCHNTTGWRQVSSDNFDHNKTRFPLQGKHLQVLCANCHATGTSKMDLKFTACMDCHADYHHGEFAKRESKGKCEECHTVTGFSPAQFLLSQHAQSNFPLLGAHQAVPCIACHESKKNGERTQIFAFASTRCLACHKDPHGGQVDKIISKDGCEHCHSVERWTQVKFDHNSTKFPLEGKHSNTPCSKCHQNQETKGKVVSVNFTAIAKECQSCHPDQHRGQLIEADGITDCARCHSPNGWIKTHFDHSTSRYKLDGAHRNVPCQKCHPSRSDDKGAFALFKPLETSCASCHGDAMQEGRLK